MLIRTYTPIMNMLSSYLILLTALSAIDASRLLSLPPTFTCNVTTFESSKCSGQQLGNYTLNSLSLYAVHEPCGYGYPYDKDLVECCVEITPALLHDTNVSHAFISCSRDETQTFHHGDLTVIKAFMFVVVPLMVLLLAAAWCCIRYYYRRSKERRQQGGLGDEEATVPEDDSLSMVSI